MKSKTYRELTEKAYEYLTLNRFPNTNGHREAKRFLKKLLREKSIPFWEEPFSVKKRVPIGASLELEGRKVQAFPFVGSIGGSFEGYLKEDFIEGDIALQTARGIDWNALKAKNIKAVVCYLKELDQVFYGITEEEMAVVSIKRENLPKVKDFYTKLKVEVREEELKLSNLVFELGRGPVVYVVAHMDTKPKTQGAIDNGLASLLLPYLYEELRENYNTPFRLRFLITDGEEVGLEGSKFHTLKKPKHAYYCINLDGIGWQNPAILYKDKEGYNDYQLAEAFYRSAKEIGFEVEFRAVPSAKSDHIPFKRAGLKTLFLSSHPLPIRHTLCDTYDAVDWHTARLWFFSIVNFLKNLGRF
jgi:Predicted aminopeptidases